MGAINVAKKIFKMKIVNIILTSQDGGAEQAFIDYLRVLKNLGHEVLAIVKADAPYVDKILAFDITVEKITNHLGYYDIFAAGKITKIIRKFAPDAAIANGGRAMVLMRKAILRVRNKKIFFIALNHSMNVKRSIGADLVLSVNKKIFYHSLDCGQNIATSFVIPNAIDLTDAVSGVLTADLQKKEKIVIGMLGRFHEAKGFDYAIKAVKYLQKISGKKFILKIAGHGEQKQFLSDLVKKLDLKNEVEFLGWIQDKKSFFEAIDIFCLPSRRETFGLVLLEAMKYQKPIISTSCDGPQEFLRNEIDALMISLMPPDNIEERLARAVIKIIDEPKLLNQMVKNAFTKVQQEFSYAALERSLQEIVGKVRQN
jgi:glycosyltransferase involved in cell wall biosynthesis